MDEYYDDGMVCLLPSTTDWCRIDLPHLTIVYLGKISELMTTDQNEIVKQAMMQSIKFPPINCGVMSVEEFGDTEPVDVLLLQPSPPLLQLYELFREWDASDHSFSPHCTIGPKGAVVGTTVPEFLTFDRIQVNWGTETTVFKLVG